MPILIKRLSGFELHDWVQSGTGSNDGHPGLDDASVEVRPTRVLQRQDTVGAVIRPLRVGVAVLVGDEGQQVGLRVGRVRRTRARPHSGRSVNLGPR